MTLGAEVAGSTKAATRTRADGRHVLHPAVCSVAGDYRRCVGALTPGQIQILHNEGGQDAQTFPARAASGLFFSEALDAANPAADDYFQLIAQSMAVIAEADGSGPMSVADLVDRGRRIQDIDAAFADARVELPLDALHRCTGPDPSHQYAKITLCRTTFPVQVSEEVIWFFFEKFLVSYSYLEDGVRRSTSTPIHSHPLNFETVYFRSFGPGARVTEQEYHLINGQGVTLIDSDGAINERFFDPGSKGATSIVVEPGPTSEIRPGKAAIRLEPFDMEVALRERPGLVRLSDGLYRPHKVTVEDDSDVPTRYFALDNYFGPIGRVLLHERDGANLWRHDDWD